MIGAYIKLNDHTLPTRPRGRGAVLPDRYCVMARFALATIFLIASADLSDQFQKDYDAILLEHDNDPILILC